MYNIIKSLNFQTRRDNVTVYAVICGILTMALVIVDDPSNALKSTGSDIAAGYSEGIAAMAVGYMLVVLISRICGWDQGDKTINYEILSGHSKSEIYFSRMIVSLGWGISLSAAMFLCPLIFSTILNGWGSAVSLSGMALRLALTIFPIIRLISAVILLNFIIKKFSSGHVISFLFVHGSLIYTILISELLPEKKTSFETSVSNIINLFYMNGRMGFIDGKDITVYDASLEPSFIVGTVAVSVIMSALYILLGYVYFKKNDMQ